MMIKKLLEIIPYGKENRIPKKKIMQKLNINGNTLNQLIKEARREYIIFVDGNTGECWRSNNKMELEEFIIVREKAKSENDRAILIARNEIQKIEKENTNDI